jgi:hypothetical protein
MHHQYRPYAVLGRIARFLRSKSIDQGVDFRNGEASHPDVEIQIDFEQAFELFGEQLLIPAGVHRQLVVGQHIGALLFERHGFDAHTRFTLLGRTGLLGSTGLLCNAAICRRRPRQRSRQFPRNTLDELRRGAAAPVSFDRGR